MNNSIGTNGKLLCLGTKQKHIDMPHAGKHSKLVCPFVHLLLQKRSMAKASNLQKYLSKCLKCIKQWLSVNFFNPLQPTKSTLTDCLAYWSVRLCQLNLKQLSCSSLLVQNEVSSHFQFVAFLRYFFGFWSRPSGSFVLSMGSNPGTFYILST